MKGTLKKIFPEGQRVCKEKTDQYREDYVKSWSKFTDLFTSIYPKTKEDVCRVQLTDKHKSWLKDKFKTINAVSDELFQESKNYSIPDPDMKTRIRLDLQNWIITLFSEFYSKMRTINFSSHQGKYMKLTPDDISEKIDRLFDTS